MFKFNFLIIMLLSVSLPAMADSPDFALPDLNGRIHHLSEYQGKWVIVNYWATWCPPCLDEIPELEDFHSQHHQHDAVVVGINYEETSPTYLKSFVDENMISYPILRADLSRAPVFGRLNGLPTSFIVSPQGKLVKTKIGSVSKDYLEQVIQQFNKQSVVVTK